MNGIFLGRICPIVSILVILDMALKPYRSINGLVNPLIINDVMNTYVSILVILDMALKPYRSINGLVNPLIINI